MFTQQSRVFRSVRFILPTSSSEKRREAIKRIMVQRAAASRKLSLKRVDSKLRRNRSINKNTKSIGRKILTEYLQDSSVHGVQYFSNLRIRPSIVGKVFWILVMLISLACRWRVSFSYVQNVYKFKHDTHLPYKAHYVASDISVSFFIKSLN